jgi:hypothetical protein
MKSGFVALLKLTLSLLRKRMGKEFFLIKKIRKRR